LDEYVQKGNKGTEHHNGAVSESGTPLHPMGDNSFQRFLWPFWGIPQISHFNENHFEIHGNITLLVFRWGDTPK